MSCAPSVRSRDAKASLGFACRKQQMHEIIRPPEHIVPPQAILHDPIPRCCSSTGMARASRNACAISRVVCGLMMMASPSSFAAPAISLMISTPVRCFRRSDVLLGDQVHPVAQRGDQGNVARVIERDEVAEGHVFVLVEDRGPTDLPELAVDLADELFDLALHMIILGDAGARGNDDHDQTTLPWNSGSPSSSISKPCSRFENPFGIVQPVHRKHHLHARKQRGQDLRVPSSHFWIVHGAIEFGEMDAHGEGFHPDDAVGEEDLPEMVFVAEEAEGALEKVLHVSIGVECDEVSAEESPGGSVAARNWAGAGNTSKDGKGICRKKPIGTSGTAARSIPGSSIRW